MYHAKGKKTKVNAVTNITGQLKCITITIGYVCTHYYGNLT